MCGSLSHRRDDTERQDRRHRETTAADPSATAGTTDWADRYLERKLRTEAREHDEETGTLGFAPEASEYMEGLSAFDLSHLSRERRTASLEATVHALVAAMEREDGVADRPCGIRRAVAYSDDEPIVGLIEGLGELVSLDRETAALVAFAYYLEPESPDEDGT